MARLRSRDARNPVAWNALSESSARNDWSAPNAFLGPKGLTAITDGVIFRTWKFGKCSKSLYRLYLSDITIGNSQKSVINLQGFFWVNVGPSWHVQVERVEKASERNVKKTIRVCNVPWEQLQRSDNVIGYWLRNWFVWHWMMFIFKVYGWW